MSDPQDHQNPSSRFRSSAVSPSSTYTFSHVFPPNTKQGDFFLKTTLPLVRDALEGQNALLFTYGVTNSGKTYTVQGGSSAGSAGILPRSLDVIFNSIEGLHGNGKVCNLIALDEAKILIFSCSIVPSDCTVSNWRTHPISNLHPLFQNQPWPKSWGLR